MIRNQRNAGFTLIELMIVVAIIAIIAAVAIPKLLSARIAANENAAIATLRSVAAAQQQLQSSAAIDTDADGGGEFGFFAELAGSAPMRIYDGNNPAGAAIGAPVDTLEPAILATAFGNVNADATGDGFVERQGYNFKIYLPDQLFVGIPENGAGTGSAGSIAAPFPAAGVGGTLDPGNTEIMWCAYAWPVDAEKTGKRCFFINQEGDILQYDNRDQQYEALAAPTFDSAYAQPAGGGVADMDQDLGLAVMGFTAGDNNIWTVVGN